VPLDAAPADRRSIDRRFRDPRQFQDSNLKWTAYTYDATYGVVTAVENADSLADSADAKTLYTYNSTRTRAVKVEQPLSYPWVETVYDDRLFALGTKRSDRDAWGTEPIVAVSVYDYNGNLLEAWQADPAADPADWDRSCRSMCKASSISPAPHCHT
jgi:hypothetical protein